ncbi:hypothetical protein CLG96_00130 [Sphingomonas oleivorans]|uniref:Uncharacterized protein n=1 Tax=Sphingomonas oleivorans TaxID=1735121 RepID=A0A2T5G3F6_9SPHN|nr:hypothetical protein [Sphingomonas oleivorans]PTQ13728.1 hypothetical protein CLG96_00130 [Sphingomonas oleivorans]
MAVTADSVIVELEAKLDGYMARVNASAEFLPLLPEVGTFFLKHHHRSGNEGLATGHTAEAIRGIDPAAKGNVSVAANHPIAFEHGATWIPQQIGDRLSAKLDNVFIGCARWVSYRAVEHVESFLHLWRNILLPWRLIGGMLLSPHNPSRLLVARRQREQRCSEKGQVAYGCHG